MRLRPSEGCHGNSRWRASTPTPALRTFFFWGQVRKKPSRGTNASFSAEPEAEEVPLRAGTRTSEGVSTHCSAGHCRSQARDTSWGLRPANDSRAALATVSASSSAFSFSFCLCSCSRASSNGRKTVRSSCGAGASMICNTSRAVPRLQASGCTSNSGVGRAPWGDAHGPSPCRASRDVPPRPWPSSVPKGRCEERTRPGPSGSPSAHGASATKPAFAPPPRGSRVVRNISHVARQGPWPEHASATQARAEPGNGGGGGGGGFDDD